MNNNSSQIELELDDLISQSGFPSIDGLARKTLELWSDRAPEDKRPKYRSLAGKIGGLKRPGGATWWERRPSATDALCAAALGVLPGELGIGTKQVPDGYWIFRECSQLAPLDLKSERPCELAEWQFASENNFFPEKRHILGPARKTDPSRLALFHPYREKLSHSWAKVPRGWGRSLLASSFAASSASTGICTDTLRDALEHSAVFSPGRVVISIARPDPDDDLAALARLRRTGGEFLVLAPHGAPRHKRDNDFRRWDEIGSSESRVFKNISWIELELVPFPGWQRKLLHFAARRSREPFEPDAVADWLERYDREQKLITSPEDLLYVLSLVLFRGRGVVTTKPLIENAFEAAEIAVVQSPAGQSDPWLKQEGADLIVELSEGRVRSPSLPLDGYLSKDLWVNLVPDNRLPGSFGDTDIVTRDALARDAIRRLATAGILRPGPGGLKLEPRWVARVTAKEHVAELLRTTPPTIWGQLAAQPDRRPLVDQALRALKPDTLTRQIEQTLEASSSLGRAAALDALFVAVGQIEVALPDTLAWRFIKAVLDQSVEEPRGHFRLFTRGAPSERLDAVLASWAWSVAFPGLAARVMIHFTFSPFRLSLGRLAFPAWCSPSAEALSGFLDSLLGTHSDDFPLQKPKRPGSRFRELSFGPAIDFLMSLAQRFVDKLVDPWPTSPAAWLVAARLAAGSSFEWLTSEALDSLCSHSCAVRWLSATLQDQQARDTARAILNIVAGNDKLSEFPPRLRSTTQKLIEPNDIVALIQQHGYRWCCQWNTWISVEPRLRIAITQHALLNIKAAQQFWALVFHSSGVMGSDDIKVLELLVRSRHSTLGIAATELWRIRPSSALKLAKQELAERCTVGLACRAASSSGLNDMLPEIREALEKNPPGWLRDLLCVHAPVGGALAELAVAARTTGSSCKI